MKHLVLDFHVATARKKNPEKPHWRRKKIRLPRPVAVELARFMFNFVPKIGDVPMEFAVSDCFMKKLSDGERIHIECAESSPGDELDERIRRSFGE